MCTSITNVYIVVVCLSKQTVIIAITTEFQYIRYKVTNQYSQIHTGVTFFMHTEFIPDEKRNL